IVNNDKDNVRKALELFENWQTQNLQQDLQHIKVQNEIKTLQIESEDISKELNMHANTIGSKRYEFILGSHKCSSENYKGRYKEEEEESYDFEKQDGYEDTYIDISETTGAQLMDALRTEYQEMFENMNEELKWRLKSRRCVEDVIYEFENYLSHSFIIDLEDCQIMGLFTDEEREEIKSKNIKYDLELNEDW
ncbi:10216_t:CDS:2, partial [Funneliformis geosporum]